jgi:hypothetical protein
MSASRRSSPEAPHHSRTVEAWLKHTNQFFFAMLGCRFAGAFINFDSADFKEHFDDSFGHVLGIRHPAGTCWQAAKEFFTKAIHQRARHRVWARQFEKERLFHDFFLGSPARRMRSEKPRPFSNGSTVAVTSSTG